MKAFVPKIENKTFISPLTTYEDEDEGALQWCTLGISAFLDFQSLFVSHSRSKKLSTTRSCHLCLVLRIKRKATHRRWCGAPTSPHSYDSPAFHVPKWTKQAVVAVSIHGCFQWIAVQRTLFKNNNQEEKADHVMPLLLQNEVHVHANHAERCTSSLDSSARCRD